ncbi:MAG: phosphoribosyltransferase, partial [Sporichthyaceae bacterium]|nr:phosphoribosyltransferase [Sporichthyaceae bacterium]
SGRTALVVDDGVATGVTALAALAMLRRQGASRLVFAAPVGPADSVQRLREMADDVVVPWVPHPFGAVSRFYGRFEQTSDAEVRRLLAT